MIRRPLCDQRGFTLVEAILSLVVLGVAIVPLMNLFAFGAERNHLPHQVVVAGLAAYKMEEAIAARALSGWESFSVSPTAYQNVDATNFPGYQWKVEVVKVSSDNFFGSGLGAGANTRYKRITVSVLKTGEPEFALTSMVTDY